MSTKSGPAHPTGDAAKKFARMARASAEENTRRLSQSIGAGFLTVSCLFLVAQLTALVVPSAPTSVVTALRLASAFLILWAVQSRLGWEIETWGGQTLPEAVDLAPKEWTPC